MVSSAAVQKRCTRLSLFRNHPASYRTPDSSCRNSACQKLQSIAIQRQVLCRNGQTTATLADLCRPLCQLGVISNATSIDTGETFTRSCCSLVRVLAKQNVLRQVEELRAFRRVRDRAPEAVGKSHAGTHALWRRRHKGCSSSQLARPAQHSRPQRSKLVRRQI